MAVDGGRRKAEDDYWKSPPLSQLFKAELTRSDETEPE